MNEFAVRAKELSSETIEMRRELHQIPELGLDLPRTTKYVMEKLKELGLEPKEICKSGVTAVIEGKKPGKTLILRADMDGLPMEELADLSFRSTEENSHTCGHDLHTAMLLTAAKMLVEKKDELCGRVKLMFQPAEEIFSGAEAMLKGGLMENPKVDAAMDMHVMSEIPVGTITNRSGFVTASCDGFKITVTGKACHGAQPHNGIDPIATAAHLHTALQQLIARETQPSKIAVLTIGQFVAGTTSNIIPEEAVMQGTLRCYDRDLRAYLVGRIHEMTEHIAKAFGATAKVEVFSDVPSIAVDKELLANCMGYIDEMGLDLKKDEEYLFTASDDFARVSELVPSTFIALGARPYEDELYYPNHNSNVIFNEDCLPIGSAIFAQCAFRWLADNQ
ncbi:amidohydrolase [Aequitasia blattaphilus]|uniref:M20 family metallopeptidase n=1 Tax=Aequitasia blattaphilus TaxID=2949332 RepID=A0ABT1EAV4_9FIRM|nr:M20 family metallopeptidase [Aequitasia blattaphilus]MCP1102960.1 M20 family metallopeptidase [Aequitasia blattaphilus]MCR8615600.1 M20 family metallopeptidase [Aequitasia blattaphilus]